MPVFADSIAADPDRPSEGDGYVRAETAQQAVVYGKYQMFFFLFGRNRVYYERYAADELRRRVLRSGTMWR